MKKVFIFYPHCYLKSTNKEILIYDTIEKKHVYIKKNPLSQYDTDSFQKGYVVVSEKLLGFINQCMTNGLGYYGDFGKVLPYMYNRGLEFVVSLSKEKKALGYNLHSSTNSLLKEVTILLNNHKEGIPRDVCLQMGIPSFNDTNIDMDYTLRQLSSFHNMETIILSGELDEFMLSKVLKYTEVRNIHVTHRILFDSIENVISLHFLKKFENLSIELLVDGSTDIRNLEAIVGDKVFVKAVIKSIDEIKMFRNFKDIMFIPVLFSPQIDMDILKQMFLSEEEILQSPKSLKDCFMSNYINSESYGHLVIDCNGEVSCMGERIATVCNTDLSSIVNAWIGNKNCLWYYTRKKKESCKDCALQDLCPPISIYEKLGYYKCPCGK